ncbi:hypothetical protein GQ54DRAFT_110409 [Martensiomyces pterosporus]|nr:hypothetical protein GQ54DRAFT_110409 [Martensiomyces pterosporus]
MWGRASLPRAFYPHSLLASRFSLLHSPPCFCFLVCPLHLLASSLVHNPTQLSPHFPPLLSVRSLVVAARISVVAILRIIWHRRVCLGTAH